MTVHYQGHGVTLHHGDCLDVLRSLPDASVDSVVTDPPYGLEFMGKEWDKFDERAEGQTQTDTWGQATTAIPGSAYASTLPRYRGKQGASLKPFQDWCEMWAAECLRVLKPGGHLLAFGGTRTWHRLACAVEDAGFEVRDSLAWLYGSGFPKSLDVSKAIDKAAGAERDRVPFRGGIAPGHGNYGGGGTVVEDGTRAVDTPATDAAREWAGFGTALKPAFEPVVVARKPLIGTVAANVTTHGTGALNIDACRIGTGEDKGVWPVTDRGREPGWGMSPEATTDLSKGRWPANVILDEDMAGVLDQQSGTLTSGKMKPTHTTAGVDGRASAYGKDAAGGFTTMETYGDSGGASRFFYVAKAPKRERPVVDGVAHPTVKPLALMRWLVRLVTPPGGVVLEPFAGSGTTVEACLLEGFQCVAIEKGDEYLPLILERIRRQVEPPEVAELVRTVDQDEAILEQVHGQLDIFGEATA